MMGFDIGLLMGDIFQIPAYVMKIETSGKTLRMKVDAQDVLSAENLKRVFDWHNKLGWMTFSIHQIEAENLVDLPPLKMDSTKTPAKRMRDVLFVLWDKDNHGYDVFDNFYVWYMSKMIDKIKEKLD